MLLVFHLNLDSTFVPPSNPQSSKTNRRRRRIYSMNTAFVTLSNTIPISASTASASATLTGSGGTCVRVYNASTAVAYVRWGAGAQTAVTTDTFLAPGATETFQINGNQVDTVAAILSADTGSVLFQRGSGA